MKKTSLQRLPRCARFILFGFALLLVSASLGNAQTPRPTPPPPPPSVDGDKRDDPPLTTFEEEMRAKRAIKMAEKDHKENVERAKELADLGQQLQTGLKDKTTIDRDSLKKLDRLEKLTKKIRGEAGGQDEEVKIVDRPANITDAVKQIAESAESLAKNVQNTPRQVISASMIGNANVLLELIRILRTFDTRSQ